MIKVLDIRHGRTPYISRKNEKYLETLDATDWCVVGADNYCHFFRALFDGESTFLCVENDTYFVADFPYTVAEAEKLFPDWFRNGGV